MVISSFQQYDAPPDSNLAPKTPKKNNNNKIKPKIKNKIKKLSRKRGEKNLVLMGRPNGAPSMYKAHSTYSSAFISSVIME